MKKGLFLLPLLGGLVLSGCYVDLGFVKFGKKDSSNTNTNTKTDDTDPGDDDPTPSGDDSESKTLESISVTSLPTKKLESFHLQLWSLHHLAKSSSTNFPFWKSSE